MVALLEASFPVVAGLITVTGILNNAPLQGAVLSVAEISA